MTENPGKNIKNSPIKTEENSTGIMEQPIPDWLNKDFLAQSLQNAKRNQSIEVTDFHATLAVPAGNNYGSCVVRAKVMYKEAKDDHQVQSVSLIIKSEVTEGPLKDFASEMKFKEPIFYKRFLPEASKLSKIDFAPESFFSPLPLVTVLEDLKVQGFVMEDRLKLLDFDHCRLYLEVAASFHAVSFAVHKTNPELIESLGSKMEHDSNTKTLFKAMIKNGLECFANATGKVEKYKKYSKAIIDISEDLFELVEKAQEPGSGMNCLTQGDPWTTNMMFRYDDKGVVREVKLLDFQALRYTSPINDLMVFIWACAAHDVKRNQMNDLYKIYINAFNLKMQELNCSERLTMESILDNIKRLRPFIVQLVGSFLPFMSYPEPVDWAVVLQKDNENNPFEKYYNESFRTNHLPYLLDEFEMTGVLDYLENYQK